MEKTFETLKTVKAGDEFVFNGVKYKAFMDAHVTKGNGFEMVMFNAGRVNKFMMSGYELSTILEFQRVS